MVLVDFLPRKGTSDVFVNNSCDIADLAAVPPLSSNSGAAIPFSRM
jgi:hypothetical protein